MTAISKLRFDALAGYARLPIAELFGKELGYFSHPAGNVLGMVLLDIEDGDFFGMVFAQDSRLRYRSVAMTEFVSTPEVALADLEKALEIAATQPPVEHYQGDEKGAAVDFFTPVRPIHQLNSDFNLLRTEETFSPALGVIEPMMRWYEDADGNFVEQFQTTGFDQRVWELYLFAMLIEQGFQLDRADAVPDFCCTGLAGNVTIEAVTVGPTRKDDKIVPPPPISTPAEQRIYVREYMPIKFGSALYSKLQKKYWLRPNVASEPFVLAVADFSSPGSMIHTRSALETYLFGYEHDFDRAEDGRLIIKPRKIEKHSFGDKVIPSGFFALPDAEHISAVISTTSGTISKFNRMGLQAGFGTGRVLMIREGTLIDHDPNASAPKLFRAVVNAPSYRETWVEGLSVFHNPNALKPLDPNLFPGAAHHFVDSDGQMTSFTPDIHPLASITRLSAPVNVAEALEALGDQAHRIWTMDRDDADNLAVPPVS